VLGGIHPCDCSGLATPCPVTTGCACSVEPTWHLNCTSRSVPILINEGSQCLSPLWPALAVASWSLSTPRPPSHKVSSLRVSRSLVPVCYTLPLATQQYDVFVHKIRYASIVTFRGQYTQELTSILHTSPIITITSSRVVCSGSGGVKNKNQKKQKTRALAVAVYVAQKWPLIFFFCSPRARSIRTTAPQFPLHLP
jgi:hypothetical protein